MKHSNATDSGSKLSLKEVYSQSLGMIIGAGIITSTGFCIGYTGRGVWLAYVLAGITMLFAYLPSILGGSVVPKTSGNYYMVCQFHPAIGGFYSLLMIFSCISIGFMGASFAQYMTSLIPFGNKRLWGIAILTVFFLANLLEQKQVVKIQTFQNILLVLAWGSFCLLGLGRIRWSAVFNIQEIFPNGAKGMYEAVTMLVFAMGGGLWLIDSGERIENPERNVLLGNLASTGTGMILFAIIAIVASGVLPVEEVANQPLTKVAQEIYPGFGYILFVAGGALIALCTTINARFLAAANGLLRCSVEGWFPAVLGKKNKNNVPYYFLTLVYLITILPIVFDLDLQMLNRLSAAITLLIMLLPNLSFPLLLKNHPEEWKRSRYHMPRWAVTVLFVGSNGVMMTLIVKNVCSLPATILGIAAVILAAFVLYTLFRYPYVKRMSEAKNNKEEP